MEVLAIGSKGVTQQLIELFPIGSGGVATPLYRCQPTPSEPPANTLPTCSQHFTQRVVMLCIPPASPLKEERNLRLTTNNVAAR